VSDEHVTIPRERLKQLEAAEAERSILRSDKERLEFIECSPDLHLRYRKGRWSFVGLTNYPYSTHRTLREAIDAAMKAEVTP
jgi:hypothetical protein